ncbi:MAG: hypothetical protein LBT62_01560 [Deltaproteobacteria bacterium]|jgi:hypothetical protein|nr:hypothetical protein [Deltaproteobacteria bacterium]
MQDEAFKCKTNWRLSFPSIHPSFPSFFHHCGLETPPWPQQMLKRRMGRRRDPPQLEKPAQ